MLLLVGTGCAGRAGDEAGGQATTADAVARRDDRTEVPLIDQPDQVVAMLDGGGSIVIGTVMEAGDAATPLGPLPRVQLDVERVLAGDSVKGVVDIWPGIPSDEFSAGERLMMILVPDHATFAGDPKWDGVTTIAADSAVYEVQPDGSWRSRVGGLHLIDHEVEDLVSEAQRRIDERERERQDTVLVARPVDGEVAIVVTGHREGSTLNTQVCLVGPSFKPLSEPEWCDLSTYQSLEDVPAEVHIDLPATEEVTVGDRRTVSCKEVADGRRCALVVIDSRFRNDVFTIVELAEE